jgi:hypothetical protein
MDNTSNSLMPRYDSKNILFPATVSFFFFSFSLLVVLGFETRGFEFARQATLPSSKSKEKIHMLLILS